MATVVSRVDNHQAFWREVVSPDYDEFIANIADLRRAFHCAITLFHLSDWIYVAYGAYIDANFTFNDKNGTTRPVCDEKTFANALSDLYPNFELVRGIANSAKHLGISRTRARPHPSAPSHAANTVIQTTGWGEGGYGKGPYGGTKRVMLEGPQGQDLEFSDLATSTYDMWKVLSQQHGWQIE